jgi:hypothetical protein
MSNINFTNCLNKWHVKRSKQKIREWTGITHSRIQHVYKLKVLSIRPNTTYRSSKIVFYYALQHASVVQISHRQIDAQYTKEMSRERDFYRLFLCFNFGDICGS